jgi:uridine kinase
LLSTLKGSMVILLNGAIASGKTTTGRLLERTLREQGHSVCFYDLDEEIQKVNPNMVWSDEKKQLHDWLRMRKHIAEAINHDIQQKKVVVVSGPFFTKPEIKGLIDYIADDISVFLFTLHVSLEQRIAREKIRNRNAKSVLMDQEQLLAELLEKFGSVVENMNEPKITVMTILQLVAMREGLLERKLL